MGFYQSFFYLFLQISIRFIFRLRRIRRESNGYSFCFTRVRVFISFEVYDDLSSAINDEMTNDAAYQLLSKDEQRNWSMTLKEFKQKAKDGGYDQELNREYFKSRITRLEQLENQLYFELVETANTEAASMGNHLSGQLNESYLRSVYEITDRASFSLSFDRFSSVALQVAISKPWKGSNFSSRVWGNHTKYLPDKLSKVMAQAKVSGWGVDRMTKEMMYGVDKTLRNRMITLVQTESAHLAEVATDKAMEHTGVEEWEWLATLEIHTCEICGVLDGQTFAIDDKTAPIIPAHPNCRCTKVPVIPGWRSSSRWQRDPITGKGSIGENITFDEWKDANVTPKVEQQLKMERNRRKDEKQYKDYLSVIGRENMPNSLADFIDLKYNDSKSYESLKKDIKDYKRWIKSDFPSEKSFTGHFESHGSEFPNVAKEEYKAMAGELLAKPVDDRYLGYETEHRRIRYDSQDNVYALGNNLKGKITTMFVPEKGVEYYEQNKKRDIDD